MRVEADALCGLDPVRAWALLADLQALDQWAPDVAASPAEALRVGAVRRARLKKPASGKATLVERVVAVGERSFTYDIEGGIGPLRAIRTTWSVQPDGTGSRIEVASTLGLSPLARLLRPLVARAWKRQLQALVDGFVAWADAKS